MREHLAEGDRVFPEEFVGVQLRPSTGNTAADAGILLYELLQVIQSLDGDQAASMEYMRAVACQAMVFSYALRGRGYFPPTVAWEAGHSGFLQEHAKFLCKIMPGMGCVDPGFRQ